MTIDEIKNGESSHIEFKREIPEKKENFLKTVSAFSNTSGGKIVFGIDNKTLEVIGIEDDIFKLMEEWGSGFRRINQECENANLNLPKFQENELDCSTVFERVSNCNCQKIGDKSATKQNFGDKSAKNEKSDNVLATSTKDKIIEYLKTHDNSKSQEIADYIGLKISRTKDYLSKLAEEGIIEAIGGNKNRTYVLKVDS